MSQLAVVGSELRVLNFVPVVVLFYLNFAESCIVLIPAVLLNVKTKATKVATLSSGNTYMNTQIHITLPFLCQL